MPQIQFIFQLTGTPVQFLKFTIFCYISKTNNDELFKLAPKLFISSLRLKLIYHKTQIVAYPTVLKIASLRFFFSFTN